MVTASLPSRVSQSGLEPKIQYTLHKSRQEILHYSPARIPVLAHAFWLRMYWNMLTIFDQKVARGRSLGSQRDARGFSIPTPNARMSHPITWQRMNIAIKFNIENLFG